MYYSSLVSYDKTLKTYKDLNDDKIGIIEDVNDIEGYVLPKEIIGDLKLDNNNKIVKYNSTMELLHALKNKEDEKKKKEKKEKNNKKDKDKNKEEDQKLEKDDE